MEPIFVSQATVVDVSRSHKQSLVTKNAQQDRKTHYLNISS